ncbi:MAG: FAD-dependent oxidoreductase [Streptosporangiaceae bacterium]
MTQLHDVAIVGAGLLGLAAGRALAARGLGVVVLEQAEIGHPGAGSKGSCRIFRLGYAEPAYVAAAQLARESWHELESESARRILHPASQLTFGSGLQAVHDAMRAAGAPCELLTAAEAAARFPAVRTGGPALLEPDSAVIAADEALAALAARVPQVRTGVRVDQLADDGRQVTLRTSAGVLTARSVIVTAGPWSGRLLATVGVAVPGRATLEQVAYLRPADTAGTDDDPAAMPIFIAHAQQSPYGLPVPGSALYKIGIHPSGPAIDPGQHGQSPDPYLLGRLSEVASRHLPGYDPDPAATERCTYDNSPDEDFILDRTGNVVIGCGTSGHGFKFGPLLGEWLADLATGTAPAGQLQQRFAVGRFSAPVF